MTRTRYVDLLKVWLLAKAAIFVIWQEAAAVKNMTYDRLLSMQMAGVGWNYEESMSDSVAMILNLWYETKIGQKNILTQAAQIA